MFNDVSAVAYRQNASVLGAAANDIRIEIQRGNPSSEYGLGLLRAKEIVETLQNAWKEMGNR